MWRETTKHSHNRKIFQEELDSFLPDRILDFHVHVFNENVVPPGETFCNAGHPIVKYDLDDLAQDLEEIYPGRESHAVCFGFPDVHYDFTRNNAYLAQECDGQRFFALRLFDPLIDTPEALEHDLSTGKFLGIKPYPDYVRKPDLNDVEVDEMLPPWAMEIVNERGMIVMLHIPRRDRLADPLNQRQVADLCKRYSNTKIILAHIGRAYFLKNILGNLETFKTLPNLFYDLTMVNHWEVMEHLFQTVRPESILYGTDIPIAIAPGKSVEINHQYTYITPVPWKLSISDDHDKIVFTSFLYEELRAIKKAVERLRLSDRFIQGIFYENGMRMIETVIETRKIGKTE